ncbi:MAG: acetyl-CoA hydrolase/transferase C-terminal domain-containing protein [Lachnospiraceae bacterium]|nr:acetyl-CoA hydrolase/transferase C-terminal domain-containing protein [Lachnospiraceae bacterium]
MQDWQKIYQDKLRDVDQAVQLVRDGDTVYTGTASSEAYQLSMALWKRKDDFSNVTICSATTSRVLPFYTEEAKGHFSILTYFAGVAERAAMKVNNCRYTSLHLSNIRGWCQEVSGITVAFFEVSPPDRYGYMSLGAEGPAMHRAVVEVADRIILQVNKEVPYVYGQDNLIHVSEADVIVEADDPIDEFPDLPLTDDVKQLSEYIVREIPDGATIQLGLGGISGAVGYGLTNKKDLGVHSEMMTGSMKYLMEEGVITNRKKTFMPGKTVCSFAMGTRDLYEFIDRNPEIYMGEYTFVNNPYNIAKNELMMSVNTAMSVDLYGQVCADNLGGRQQSATGGQLDYVRGAQMSKGGKSFIALTSVLEKKGKKQSKIVASFPPGTAITTPRQDVQYLVTEYGCVNLRELTIDQRAKAMISLAHPDFREELTDQAKQLGLIN